MGSSETKCILIIEDDKHTASLVEIYLEREGFKPLKAYDGEQGLAMAEKYQPQLVILDLMLPKMDGWDTINEIANRGLTKNVAISIITGKGTNDYQKMSLLGSYIYDYLPKPIDINKLIVSMEKCYKIFQRKMPESLI